MQIDDNSTCGGQRLKGILAKGGVELPLVTVVTAVFNGQPHVAGCLESVLTQDYPNIEHIILDGGSTDGTLDVLRQYDDRVAFWKSEPDKGVYDAWNKGLALAQGEWIAFLGSDDEYLPGAIRAYMELAVQSPNADYLTSHIRWQHSAGYSRQQGGPWSWPLYSRYMCSAHVGSMHRRRLFYKYGQFDLSYKITADYEFLLRPRGALRTAFLPQTTIMMRAGGVSDSTAALHEASRAKIHTGGRARWTALPELALALCKYRARTLVNRLLLAVNHRSTLNHVPPSSTE